MDGDNLFEHLPVACIVLDRKGAIRELNSAARQLLGSRLEALAGLPFASLVIPARQSAFLRHLWEAFREPGRVVTLETRLKADHFEVPLTLSSRATEELCSSVLAEMPATPFPEHPWSGGLTARELFDCLPLAALLCGSRGTVEAVNPAAERLLGYAPEELEGRRLITVLSHPHTEGPGPHLAFAHHRDGRDVPVEAVSFTGKNPASILLLRDRSDDGRHQRLLSHVVREQRRLLGQELHDSVGQSLTGMALLAQCLADELEGNPRARRLAELTIETTGAIRRLIRGACRDEPAEADLCVRLSRLARATSELHGVRCLARCSRVELDQETLEQLELIAQEAVTNAVRHGRARRILIRWGRAGSELRLSVSDDGVGLQPRRRVDGLGIRGMRHRAAVVGGNLVVKDNPRGGTLVECRLPNYSEANLSR